MKKIFFFCLVLFFASCSLDDDEIVIQTLIVASERQPCQGNLVNQQCLLVKNSEDQSSWSFFFDPIIGFNHEEGFEYVIRVNRELVSENANIADSSIYEYTLLEILSKIEKTSEGL
jgi:hypothetical protein